MIRCRWHSVESAIFEQGSREHAKCQAVIDGISHCYTPWFLEIGKDFDGLLVGGCFSYQPTGGLRLHDSLKLKDSLSLSYEANTPFAEESYDSLAFRTGRRRYAERQ